MKPIFPAENRNFARRGTRYAWRGGGLSAPATTMASSLITILVKIYLNEWIQSSDSYDSSSIKMSEKLLFQEMVVLITLISSETHCMKICFV